MTYVNVSYHRQNQLQLYTSRQPWHNSLTKILMFTYGYAIDYYSIRNIDTSILNEINYDE